MGLSMKSFWIEATLPSAKHILTSRQVVNTACWIVASLVITGGFAFHMYLMIAQYLQYEKLVNVKVRFIYGIYNYITITNYMLALVQISCLSKIILRYHKFKIKFPCGSFKDILQYFIMTSSL